MLCTSDFHGNALHLQVFLVSYEDPRRMFLDTCLQRLLAETRMVVHIFGSPSVFRGYFCAHIAGKFSSVISQAARGGGVVSECPSRKFK